MSTYIVFGSVGDKRPVALANFPNDRAAHAAFEANNKYGEDATLYKLYDGGKVDTVYGRAGPVTERDTQNLRDYAIVDNQTGTAKVYEGLDNNAAKRLKTQYGSNSRMFSSPSKLLYGQLGQVTTEVVKLDSSGNVLGRGRFTESAMRQEHAKLGGGETLFLKNQSR